VVSRSRDAPPGAEALRRYWSLDPDVLFLNHGSFGACPIPILELQDRLRSRMEREPVQFFMSDFVDLIGAAREALAAFIHVDPAGLAFVPNATTGVNAVVRSLEPELMPGDELLVTDHAYNACRNALDFVAGRSGAEVIVAHVPFPVEGPEVVLQAVTDRISDRTRLALIDHITSPTGLILPLERILDTLHARDVDVVVDGAHAPGMLDLDVGRLGVAFYAGNCHKWMCAPKGAGFLWVRDDYRERIHPLTISHGANAPLAGRSRFQLEFDWVGTDDYSAWFVLPELIAFMDGLVPGGWAEIRERNHTLAVEARGIVCDALEIDRPCPDEMIGTLGAIPLPDGPPDWEPDPLQPMPFQHDLFERHRIEIPLMCWPAPPKRLLRLSAQLYNSPDQYHALARALKSLL
jgi:isopenicillin-N epimerase